MKIEKIRAFRMTDSKMLETARTLHSQFNDHMADFTALDAQLDATFATHWLAVIVAGDTVHQDNQIKDIQAQLTNIVLEKMELCRIKYHEVKYFAGKAIPNDKTLLHEFGVDSYSNIRTRQDKMISFMDAMHKSCIKYSLELLAAGMTQAQIDEVATLHNDLQAANTEQENYINFRPKLTQNRINTLNECYHLSMKVVEAAKIIYYNDYAMYNMFVFDRTGSSGGSNNGDDGADDGSGNTTDTVSIHIVADNIPVQIYSIAYNPTRQYVLTNNGPGEVEFYITDDINSMGTPILLLAGDSQTFTAQDLGYIGDLLIAKAMPGIGAEADITAVISL